METTKKITGLEAIKLLSRQGDGARKRDNAEFSAADTRLTFFSEYEELTQEQQEEFLPILNKYSKTQLNAEIIMSETLSSEKYIKLQQKITNKKRIKKAVKIEANQATISFSYNSEMVASVRSIPGVKYNSSDKSWTVKISEENKSSLISFLNDWFFDFSETELKDIKCAPSKGLKLSGEIINVAFDYEYKLVEAIKTIPSRKYDSATKSWNLPVSAKNAKDIQDFLNTQKFSVSTEISNLIDHYINECKEKAQKQAENKTLSACLNPSKDFKVKSGLTGVLRNFQVAGVEYIVNNKKVILGDEMGTGKTIQSLVSVYHTNAFPCLVICPNSIKYNWLKEGNKWLPNFTVKVIESSNNPEDIFGADVYVTNYNTVSKFEKEFSSLDLKSVIIDESHYAKNHKAKRTVAIKSIVTKSNPELIIELTGTIIINRPQELISQLDILGKLEDFGGFWGFASRYCAAHRTRFGMDMSGAQNLPELHQKMREICYIRREKKDVLTELPEMQIQSIEVDITNRSLYNKAEANLISYFKNEFVLNDDFLQGISDLSEEEQKIAKAKFRQEKVANAEAAEHLVRINALKSLVAEGKMKASIDFIENIIENEKLVVFTSHRIVASELSKYFKCNKIDGSVKSEDRQKFVDDFQENPNTKLIVVNIAAGREGLTLTAASKLVFIELGWTPGEMEQAAARIHRIGQVNTANIYYLIGKNTIDEMIFSLLEKKREITQMVASGIEGQQTSGVMKDLIHQLTKSE